MRIGTGECGCTSSCSQLSNQNRPIFSIGSTAELVIPEDIAVGSQIRTLAAVDPDTADGIGLFFTIDDSQLRVGTSSGIVEVTGSFLGTAPILFNTTISVSDGALITTAILPVRVICRSGFEGPDCSNCAFGFGGSTCSPCEPCENGDCGEGGACTCHPGWGGDRCSVCRALHFGLLCEPIAHLESVIPAVLWDVGGETIEATVVNVISVPVAAACRFSGLATINATSIARIDGNSVAVRCFAPRMPKGQAELTVEIEGVVVDGTISISIVSECEAGLLCPAGQGTCAYRACICSRGWVGAGCTTPVLPPTSSGVSNAVVTAGVRYAVTIPLNGSDPMALTLTSPEEATISGRTVEWDTVCSGAPAQFAVLASNGVGTSAIEWNVTVGCPYAASVAPSVAQTVVAPTIVEIVGTTTPTSPGEPVAVVIDNGNTQRFVVTDADPGGNFSMRLQLDR